MIEFHKRKNYCEAVEIAVCGLGLSPVGFQGVKQFFLALLKVVFATFLLACFVCLKESTLKALSILEIII